LFCPFLFQKEGKIMNEEKMDQKIIEKLQKLLALTASDNEHEAGLAMSKAEALMREHNLSVADVALNGSGASVQSEEVNGLTRAVQKWETRLGGQIAWAFNGKAIRCTSPEGGWYMTFVAGRTDLTIIVDLFERLRETVKRMSKAYATKYYSPHFRIKRHYFLNSYRLGMVKTIQERLARLKENTAPDDTKKNDYGLTGRELMVVKDKAIAQRVSQLFPNTRNVCYRASRIVTAAYEHGQSDGNSVSLHRSVGGSDGPVAVDR
jgi:hypothetical protein